jgi:hypothetical protein
VLLAPASPPACIARASLHFPPVASASSCTRAAVRRSAARRGAALPVVGLDGHVGAAHEQFGDRFRHAIQRGIVQRRPPAQQTTGLGRPTRRGRNGKAHPQWFWASTAALPAIINWTNRRLPYRAAQCSAISPSSLCTAGPEVRVGPIGPRTQPGTRKHSKWPRGRTRFVSVNVDSKSTPSGLEYSPSRPHASVRNLTKRLRRRRRELVRFGNMAGERTSHENWRRDRHRGAPACKFEFPRGLARRLGVDSAEV